MRVLVVEDDEAIANVIAELATYSGMSVSVVRDGRSANAALQDAHISGTHYDAVSLDLDIPAMRGLDVLKAMRARADATPVLIVSGAASSNHKVTGLDVGADDYLTKPFDADELLARLKAIARRRNHRKVKILQLGNVSLNVDGQTVRVNDEPIELARSLYPILETLIKKSGQEVDKEDLMGSSDLSSEAVKSQIHKLRKRLQEAHANISITTVYGSGYKVNLAANTEGVD